jgi:RNA polymerase sigma-70 factor (ECF subfamily)
MQNEKAEHFARLWTQVQPNVSAFLFAMMRDFHLTEDVLQQVAVLSLREFEKYDQSRPFLPWILTIARNAALTALKARQREVGELFEDDLVDEIQLGFQRNADLLDSMRRALQICLGKQQGRMREVLIHRYVRDLKPREIATRLGTTSGSIRILLHRARTALRDCIDRNLELV